MLAGSGNVGGSVTIGAGQGVDAAASGSIVLADAAGNARVTVDGAGGLALSSAAGEDTVVQSGNSIAVEASSTGEITFKHTDADQVDGVVARVTQHGIVSHLPAQFTEVRYPSDERIKRDVSGVIEEDILQKLQVRNRVEAFTTPDRPTAAKASLSVSRVKLCHMSRDSSSLSG
mgnify:CR=1 FL=1